MKRRDTSSAAARLYRRLLWIYPLSFRDAHGTSMEQLFLELHREARRRGSRARARLWLRTLGDVAWNGFAVRLLEHRYTTRISPISPRRGDGSMWSLLNDLRYAARKLSRKPTLAAVAVATLALGIGANTAIFSLVHTVFLRPLPYDQPERLALVWPDNWFSKDEFVFYRGRFRGLDGVAAVGDRSITWTGNEEPRRFEGLIVSANFFEVLGVRPVLGRSFVPEENEPGGNRVAILTHETWQGALGGDPAVLGRTLVFDGTPHEVVGVLPEGFYALPLSGEVFLPLDLDASSRSFQSTYWLKLLGRAQAGASPRDADSELRGLTEARRTLHPEIHGENYGDGAAVRPMRAGVLAEFQTPLLLLQGAVGFVLLIACVNIANLLLVSASGRRREVAVRSALGASRRRLARQMLIESLLLAGLGGVLGILVAHVGLRFLALPAERPSWIDLRIDGSVLSWTFWISIGCGLLFGLLPALHYSRPRLMEGLREAGFHGASPRSRLRSLLVTAEVALAVILVAGAGLALRSFWRVGQVDAGFDTERVLTMRFHLPDAFFGEAEKRVDFLHRLRDKAAIVPGVESAAIGQQVALSGDYWVTRIDVEGLPSEGDRGHFSRTSTVGAGYFRTVGIPRVRGRDFNDTDRADAPLAVVVNRTLAEKFWPGQDAVGKRLRRHGGSDPRWMTVVGIVGDVRARGLVHATLPTLYDVDVQRPRYAMSLFVKSAAADPHQLAPALRETIGGIDDRVPISRVATLDEVRHGSMVLPRLLAQLLTVFGVLALGLGAGGIYGVVSYVVGQRTHDIGVRLALGAGRSRVMRQVMGQGLTPVAVGVVLGIGGALALGQVLSRQLYGVSASDPLTFALVPVVLVLTASAACYLPARRASRIDPVIALRYE